MKEADRIWQAYMEEVRASYGVEPLNFLGSVEKHREMFDRAMKKLDLQDKALIAGFVNTDT